MAKEKHLVISEESHAEVKARAKEAGITIDKQIRLMLVATKSDTKKS